jgi:hypothetical protein
MAPADSSAAGPGTSGQEVVAMGRMRWGILIGLAIGYVLGTRAGRERYEQIKRAATAAWQSPPAEKLRSEVSQKMPDAVTAAMSKVDQIRHPNGDRAMPVMTPGRIID